MSYEIFLPKAKDQKEEVLVHLINQAKQLRAVKEVEWWFNYYYLQGVRNISNLNYQEGTLDVNYVNEYGLLQFRYEDIVSKFQSQTGRLLRIDLTPKVIRRNVGLEWMRKSAVAQVALDSVMTHSAVEQLKLSAIPMLLNYGIIGTVVWIDGQDMGIEVISPWEILPIPPSPVVSGDVRGLARVRTVPVDWLKKLAITPGEGAQVWTEMDKTSVPRGHIDSQADASDQQQFRTFHQTVGIGSALKQQRKKDKTEAEVAEMQEIWMKDSRGNLKEYILMAGNRHLHTIDYTGYNVPMPIATANDMVTGDFWGRSFVSLQIPLNMELEDSVSQLMQNVKDLDIYGIWAFPSSMGIPNEAARGSDGIRRFQYEPDYSVPEAKPFQMQPVNSGTFPVEAIRTATQLNNAIANQPEGLLKGDAPGRVDSSSGLGLLYETSNTPLSPTASSISQAIIQNYQSMLALMQMRWDDSRIIEISALDDTLAGVVLDPSSGTMSLADNALPMPSEVSITVQSMMPKSTEQEKMELTNALQMQTITLTEYRIMVRKKGLDLPVGNESEWQNYRRAMMENIQLFGDGTQTGQITISDKDLHEVHLEVLQAFMARPEFFLASEEVREAFQQHYEQHIGFLAPIPDQMPYPEDAAEEEAMMMQQQPQQQPQQQMMT